MAVWSLGESGLRPKMSVLHMGEWLQLVGR